MKLRGNHVPMSKHLDTKYFDYPYTLWGRIKLYPYRYLWTKSITHRYLLFGCALSMFLIVRSYEVFTHSPKLVEKYMQREATKHFRHFEPPELPKDYVKPPKHY